MTTYFDPTKPIDDETVWFPRGMLIDKKTQKLRPGPHAPRSGDDDGDQIFILEKGQMHALCRFLWTGKLLPTDRDQYVRYLGLVDTSVISKAVWSEIDNLIGTYTKISKDCTEFKDETWDKLTVLAGVIKTYSAIAGGTGTSSYYQAMLEWVGQYNDEKNKPDPDQSVLDELSESIKSAIDDEQGKITLIQDQVTKALEALTTFHDNCKVYETTIQGDEKSLQELLDKEGNNVDQLQAQIDADRADIKDAQTRIDEDCVLRLDTVLPYEYSVPIGTIAGAVIASQAEADIERLEKKIKDTQAALAADEAKLFAAKTLQADITSMRGQVTDLLDIIAPAIVTLEALQGAWAGMGADLQTLYDLFADSADSIPPMLLEKRQLQTIVEAWNDLKEYSGRYIENSFMSEEPKKQTMQDWLDDAKKYLGEAKRQRALKMN
ncbi:hypothetical protein A9Z42_0078350 [Trichoderma parareesei]|uniref:Uncharacterized protein n=1 Tax=Trichoderma parareesei TaxID=858221 RepID=A0A2H2ZYT3_TRIPA|nr:hypothetical protein A9Z42_0078350 [Trichoderma parareesei]